MSCRILGDTNLAALYCSTSGLAFGPVFRGTDSRDAREMAQSFCNWLARYSMPTHHGFDTVRGHDPRTLSQAQLITAHATWLDEQRSMAPDAHLDEEMETRVGGGEVDE